MQQTEEQKMKAQNEKEQSHKRLFTIFSIIVLLIISGVFGYMVGRRIWGTPPFDFFWEGLIIAVISMLYAILSLVVFSKKRK
jgi:hypothetical protein